MMLFFFAVIVAIYLGFWVCLLWDSGQQPDDMVFLVGLVIVCGTAVAALASLSPIDPNSTEVLCMKAGGRMEVKTYQAGTTQSSYRVCVGNEKTPGTK